MERMNMRLVNLCVCVLGSLCVKRMCSSGHFENVALNKACSMSSQYYWPNNTHPPGAAVNGNTGGKHYREDNCIHTAGNDTAPWWEVDLGRMYPVHRIVVWARTVEIHRMTGCIVYVDGKECYRFGYTEPSRTTNVTCVTGVLNGRNVTLAKNTTGFTGENITINMCELQVLSCSDDYWGSGCDRRCGNCSNSEVCGKVTGHCSSCPPGLQPPLCDREEHTGGEPISTGMLVGAVVGSLSALVVLLIVVLVAVRWQRSRSHQTNEGRATDIASYDARIDSSKIISPTNHRNPVILPSSQSDNNYEAVDGEVNHGYVNSKQDMPATTQNPAERFPATTEVCVVEGESSIGAPRKSSAPSTDQLYENVDRDRENTYERPQVYVNTGDQHVYSEL